MPRHSLQVQNLSVHAGRRTTSESTGASISFISTKCGYANGFREGQYCSRTPLLQINRHRLTYTVCQTLLQESVCPVEAQSIQRNLKILKPRSRIIISRGGFGSLSEPFFLLFFISVSIHNLTGRLVLRAFALLRLSGMLRLRSHPNCFSTPACQTTLLCLHSRFFPLS
jgi:hypothetical protein